jgi:hypothetical protein
MAVFCVALLNDVATLLVADYMSALCWRLSSATDRRYGRKRAAIDIEWWLRVRTGVQIFCCARAFIHEK